jgi:outer membrane protein assembly factor BamB
MQSLASRCRLLLLPFSFFLLTSAAQAADWIHWRGPEQNGHSLVKGLPESFEVNQPGKGGLIWKQPFGGRSAPLVMNGRLYMIGGYDMSKPTEGERVLCFDAETGAKKWEQRFNVFHTHIVSSRLGWTTLTADPKTERVYAHTTAGFLVCFDKDGKIVWEHSLTEEYGRLTGYGGRIVSPIFDSGMVIVGLVCGSWGNQARGANRFVAFDGATGDVVWWGESPYRIRGTYYSNPIVAVVNGQRLLVTGGGDGYVHAFKIRTGERVWSYQFASGVVNPSPIADGNLIYIAHGEPNPEGGSEGRVICLDASKLKTNPKTKEKEPTVVWEQKRLAKRFGLSSPALADGILYMPDDDAELYAFDAKTGKVLWRVSYGTVSRGAPLVADGKLYVFDVSAKLAIYQLNGKEEPDELDAIRFRRTSGPGFVETNGTPIAVNGKLYFLTQDDVYCVGKPGAPSGQPNYKPLPPETPFDANAAPVGLRIYPADVRAKPGTDVKFSAKFLDANGREVKAPAGGNVAWALPRPPLPPTAPKGATPPPALNGELKPTGNAATVTIGKLPHQQGYVSAKFDKLAAPLGRVRVPVQIPSTEDFTKTPIGAVPGGWVNAQGKYAVIEKDGNKVLSKVNTNSRPPVARANAYLTGPNEKNYTIACDILGTEVRGNLPDMGLVANRYLLALFGVGGTDGKRTLRIVSWEGRLRINHEIAFDWKPGTWYRVKFTTDIGDTGPGVVMAKVWPKGAEEPKEWTIRVEDPSPNREGAAGLYGYIADASISPQQPGSDIFYDNVTITPNAKK